MKINKMQKKLLISGAGAVGAISLAALAGSAWYHRAFYEKARKGLNEKLKDSKIALDAAFARVQSAFEKIKREAPKSKQP